MKIRIIEDGNGKYKLQEEYHDYHFGKQWKTVYGGTFETEAKAAAWVEALIQSNEEARRDRAIKRVVKEFDV